MKNCVKSYIKNRVSCLLKNYKIITWSTNMNKKYYLNDNDFGKQKEGVRVHNISFKPYSNNPFEFCYLLKNLIADKKDEKIF